MLDQTRAVVLIGVCSWVGLTLLLSRAPWFRHVSVVHRLQSFAPTANGNARGQRNDALIDVVRPMMDVAATRLSSLFGINDNLADRLKRGRIDTTVNAFRVRQFSFAAAGLGVTALLVTAGHFPIIMSGFLVIGAPLLAFLVLEQQVVSVATHRQQQLFAELPVMSEQLAMLLGAGYSIGAALTRLAERGGGVISEDLAIVCERLRQGLDVKAALHEWAELADLPEVHRLASVLSLSSETSNVGRLVSEEARTIRLEGQRRLAETIDRRAQQVWIPVTVATLIPGVIFLTIPFLHALSLFSAS